MPVQAGGAPLKTLCTVGRQTSLSSILSSELTKKPEVSSAWEGGGNLEQETWIMKSKQDRSRQCSARHLSAGVSGQKDHSNKSFFPVKTESKITTLNKLKEKKSRSYECQSKESKEVQ